MPEFKNKASSVTRDKPDYLNYKTSTAFSIEIMFARSKFKETGSFKRPIHTKMHGGHVDSSANESASYQRKPRWRSVFTYWIGSFPIISLKRTDVGQVQTQNNNSLYSTYYPERRNFSIIMWRVSELNLNIL